jgi:predicted Co/Zn/Cd cation transporter (cation efflux family)
MADNTLSLTSQAAQEAAQAKERVALGSIVASAIITLAKGAAGLATGSLALISDAAHSLLDVAATTMTWFAVRAANQPADEKHHYQPVDEVVVPPRRWSQSDVKTIRAGTTRLATRTMRMAA